MSSVIAVGLAAGLLLGGCSSVTETISDSLESVRGYLDETFEGDAAPPSPEPAGDTPVRTAMRTPAQIPPSSYRPPRLSPDTPTTKVIETLEKILAVDGPTRDADAVAAIASVPHPSHPELTRYLEANAQALPPLVLYELSARIYPYRQWDGVRWYFVAYTRYAYDLFRCTDASVIERIEAADRLVQGPLTKIRLEPRTAYAVALTALTWDREHPIHETSPLIECLSGETFLQTLDPEKTKVMRAADGAVVLRPSDMTAIDRDRWIKPLAEHPKLLEAARQKSRKRLESLLEMEVRLPKEWDD
jgi:hypothetical protein